MSSFYLIEFVFNSCNCYCKIKNFFSWLDLQNIDTPAVKLILKRQNETWNRDGYHFQGFDVGGCKRNSQGSTRGATLNHQYWAKKFVVRIVSGATRMEEGYSIRSGREVGRRSVVWPRSRGNSAFYGGGHPPLRKTTAPPSLGQSTQKPITGFPSVLPQHGKRISLARYSQLDIS